jgi:hypothetical protein
LVQVTGVTELTIISPSGDLSYDANENFTIQLFFRDVVQDDPIVGATIIYSLNGGISNKTDNENVVYSGGFYYITVDCNDSDFNYYGNKDIIIYALKQNYAEQSKTLSIDITGLTDLVIQAPSQNTSFDSSDSIKIRIFFNDTIKDEGIINAIINYSLNGGSTFLCRNVQDFNNGTYIITIDPTHPDFEDISGQFYGPKDIIIEAKKQYYYNQTSPTLNINLIGETGLSLTNTPDKGYYNSEETFTIELFFNDTERNEGILSADLSYRINSNDLRTDNIIIAGGGYYNITIFCNDAELRPYGPSIIIVYVNKTYYYNQTDFTSIIVMGQTSFEVTAPEDQDPFVYGEIFNITVLFRDISIPEGISNADISYSIDGTDFTGNDNSSDNGDGTYRITSYVNDSSFSGFGYKDILINISKSYYINRTVNYTFHRQFTTKIEPSNYYDLGQILRGLNVSYTFNYSDTNNIFILNANMSIITKSLGFTAYLQKYGNGTYKLHIDTSGVQVSEFAYTLLVNISAYGYQTQILNLTIDVEVIFTEIVNVEYQSEIARNSGLNQTFRFYFNDTTNNLPVLNLQTSDTRVYNNQTGSLWDTSDFNWQLIDPYNNGTYILNISLNQLILDSGWYTLRINISNYPNYDLSIYYITFYYRGNYTDLGLLSMEYSNGVDISGSNQDFNMFVDNDITIEFNVTDIENANSLVTGTATYIVFYQDLANISNNGILPDSLTYDANTFTYKGDIEISDYLSIGSYSIIIRVIKTNFENATCNFNLTIEAKYEVRINILSLDSRVQAGKSFELRLLVEYNNGITSYR